MPPRDRRRAPVALVVVGALAAGCLGGSPLGAQQPPIRLFPPVEEPAPTPPPPQWPAPWPRAEEARPAVPEAEVRVEGLAAPTADAIGLAPPEGLAGDPWRGSEPQVVLDLLQDLPVRTPNPALRALTRRLLVSPGPRGLAGDEEGRLLAARLERLLAMGELDAARALVRRLPLGYAGEAAERPAVETLLLAGDIGAACERAEEAGRRFTGPFWTKVVAFCRLRAGEGAEARLAVDLLREEAATDGGEADDPAFFALFDRLEAGAAGDDAADPALDGIEPSPLHLAMLRRARLPVPGAPLDELTPAHLAAIARDRASPPARRVAGAERAALAGALPPGELAVIYTDADVSRPSLGDFGAESIARLAATPEGRAWMFRVLRGERAAGAWAEAVDAIWRVEDDGARRVLLVRPFAAALADLRPDPEVAAAAPSAVLGLLAVGRLAEGRPDAAGAWRALAPDPRPLQPLFALAGGGRPDAEALAAWLRALPDEAAARRLLALFEGVGAPVPDEARRAVGEEATPTAAAGATSPPSRPGPGDAAAAGRTGETVLLALRLLGARPERAEPAALADALVGLRRVGLTDEARAVAVATALAVGAPRPGGAAAGAGARGDG